MNEKKDYVTENLSKIELKIPNTSASLHNKSMNSCSLLLEHCLNEPRILIHIYDKCSTLLSLLTFSFFCFVFFLEEQNEKLFVPANMESSSLHSFYHFFSSFSLLNSSICLHMNNSLLSKLFDFTEIFDMLIEYLPDPFLAFLFYSFFWFAFVFVCSLSVVDHSIY